MRWGTAAPGRISRELYGAEPAQLLDQPHAEVTDPERLMLIGHNPGMHELALMLAGSGDAAAKKELGDNLPTAGLAIFDFAIDDWSEVAFRRGKLCDSSAQNC